LANYAVYGGKYIELLNIYILLLKSLLYVMPGLFYTGWTNTT